MIAAAEATGWMNLQQDSNGVHELASMMERYREDKQARSKASHVEWSPHFI